MKLLDFFRIIFLVFYTSLAYSVNNSNIKKVKRVATINDNDCQYISSFLNQLGVEVNNCCGSTGIVCEDGRIIEL